MHATLATITTLNSIKKQTKKWLLKELPIEKLLPSNNILKTVIFIQIELECNFSTRKGIFENLKNEDGTSRK